MKISVCKRFHFSYGHFLPGHHKCGTQHGHNAVMEVTVKGEINISSGMVIDFHHLNTIVNERIVDKWDHKNLNDTPDFTQDFHGAYTSGFQVPTVENMTRIAFEKLKEYFDKANLLGKDCEPIYLERVRIYETEDSYAEVTSSDI